MFKHRLPLIWVLLTTLTFSTQRLLAQGSELYGSGIKFKLNEDGSKYMRFITWHQVWVRYNQNNSGSARQGVPQTETVDFGIRRSRFLFLTQISPRFLILMHAGINNQTSYTGGYLGSSDAKKPQLFLHDLWNEYKLINKPKFTLDLGAGIHYWHGVSRMSSASTLNFLAYDAPIFNWHNIETTDQFARYIGVYAKGKLGKIDYRFNVSEPFYTNTSRVISTKASNYSPYNVYKIYAGYASYQFWDQEANLLPFTVGTYLGSKKVFNIGAGFLHNKNAMWTKKENSSGTDTASFHDQNLFAVDAFLDLPLNTEKGTAITAYAVQYFNDFGPNFVRGIGIMNPAAQNAAGAGSSAYRGNTVPLLGTGTTSYVQAGYLLPKTISTKVRFQPYAAYTFSSFEGLKDGSGKQQNVNWVDVGSNFLLEGHHAKFTLNYRHRPDFSSLNKTDFKPTYRPEVTLQCQVYL
ncbi:MAG TPA: hypothetical protein PLK63_13295 [Catalimonadaceae bacterium]|nr:hypothetical protein [Catalimonadaceae bacterium]